MEVITKNESADRDERQRERQEDREGQFKEKMSKRIRNGK